MKKILTLILSFGILAAHAQRPVKETSPTSLINLMQRVMIGQSFYLPKVLTPPTQRPSVLNGGVDTVGAQVYCIGDQNVYVFTGGDAWKTGAILPSQTGNANKSLQTNGSSFNWAFVDYSTLLNKPDLSTFATKAGFSASGPIHYDPSTGAFSWDYTTTNAWSGNNTFSAQVGIPSAGIGTGTGINNIVFINSSGLVKGNTSGSARIQWDDVHAGFKIGTVSSTAPTPFNPSGIFLYDSTITSSGAQSSQSPWLTYEAQGWSSSLGASRKVDFVTYLTTAGGSSPTGLLHIRSSIAGAAYGPDLFTIDDQGNGIIKNHFTGTTESTLDSSDRMASTALIKQLLYQAYGAGGVTAIGTFSTTPNADGADINSSALTLHAASETYPGLMSTIDQKFAGVKTLLSAPVVSPFTTNGGFIYTNSLGKLIQSPDFIYNGAQFQLNKMILIPSTVGIAFNATIASNGTAFYASGSIPGSYYPMNIQASAGDAVYGQVNNVYSSGPSVSHFNASSGWLYTTAQDSADAFNTYMNVSINTKGFTTGYTTKFGKNNEYSIAFNTRPNQPTFYGTKQLFGIDQNGLTRFPAVNMITVADTNTYKVAVFGPGGYLYSMYWPATAGGGGGGGGEPTITAPNTTKKYWTGYKTFGTLITDSLIEGTKKFFTNALARAAITFTTDGTTGLASFDPATGILNIPDYSNPSFTFTGDVAVTGSGTLATTVNGLKGSLLPSLTTGRLVWNGSAWVFDNTTYYKATDTASTLVTKYYLSTLRDTSLIGHKGPGVWGFYGSITGDSIFDKTIKDGYGITWHSNSDSSRQGDIDTLSGNGLVTKSNLSTTILKETTAISFTSTLTLSVGIKNYSFTGSTATWTMPAVSGNTGVRIRAKNKGTGNLTIVPAGSDHIYATTQVTALVLTPGASAELFDDGIDFIVE